MRLNFWTVVTAVALLLSATDRACAWGPATHVGLAGSVLQNLHLLPSAVAAILLRHGVSYLYGNMAADMVFAKRLSRIKQFCHHWSTGFGLLDAAHDDPSRAFAYGYLSHLAADTVAHGKYVPRQIVVSECSVNFGHLYWELRADALETDADWQRLECILQMDQTHHHRALEAHITDTFLPYELNRLLFGSLNAFAVRRGFRRGIGAWSRYSRWPLSRSLVQSYRTESLDRIHAILTVGRRSALLREDPNGTSALMQLRVRRREVRRLKRRGLPVGRRLMETSRGFEPNPSYG